MVEELTVIEQIKLLINRKGVSQKETAKQVGISPVYFTQILQGKVPVHRVKKGVIERLAEYLNTSFHINILYGVMDNDKKTTDKRVS